MTEDEMVGWHHRLDGRGFEQAPGDGDGQGSWRAAVHGVAESDRAERLNSIVDQVSTALCLTVRQAIGHHP